jgi:phenylpropionate dioxygenase-like ring-hydroxylating dioxygenase large terminal subunit
MKDLVDTRTGAISREIFVNEAIYRQELEQIFARAWLFVGHESQIPRRGDFFTSNMGEESVILARDQRGRVHVFLNTCRHRGMKVCRYDEGNTAVFTCPYHGWAYANDGRLTGVPSFREGYREQFDHSAWGLVEVAQLEIYKGAIWATWDKAAPPFLEYLGGMRPFLDLLLDCRDGREAGSEVIGGVQKWRMPCNWKFAAENFVGDSYHVFSHRSADLAGLGPSGKGRRDMPWTRRIAISFPELGHGTDSPLVDEDQVPTPGWENIPVVYEYFKQAEAERRRRLGPQARLLGGASLIFPNTAFAPRQPRTIGLLNPRGPLETEMWRFYLVDADAPQEVKDAMRHYVMRYAGPGGMTEQDDMENWSYATAASKGTIARRYPYNYAMGLGFEGTHPLIPGALVTDVPMEQNQRGFYRRWAELMDAASWDGLAPNGRSAGSRTRRTRKGTATRNGGRGG